MKKNCVSESAKFVTKKSHQSSIKYLMNNAFNTTCFQLINMCIYIKILHVIFSLLIKVFLRVVASYYTRGLLVTLAATACLRYSK